MSKVDGKDFINELYEIWKSKGPDTTLPQAVSKFVAVHAQDFVFTMAQRYKDKTIVELQESFKERDLEYMGNTGGDIMACIRFEKEIIAEEALYIAEKTII